MGNKFSNLQSQSNQSTPNFTYKTEYYSNEERREMRTKFQFNDQQNFRQRKFEKIDEIQKEFIGEGSFGQVYKVNCYDSEFGSFQAVAKYFKENQNNSDSLLKQKSIQNEINILKKLFHKNIIRYFGQQKLKCDNNEKVLLFECCEYDLRQYFEQNLKNKQHQSEQKLMILHQILQGLEYLHYKYIKHGDLKMENILISSSHEIKIADFGTSKECQKLYEGTPNLMPPEYRYDIQFQLAGDVWQFGLIAYEFFGGQKENFLYQYKRNFVDKERQCCAKDLEVFFGKVLNQKFTDIQKDFLRSCLYPMVEFRYNVSQLLNHKIFHLIQSEIKHNNQQSLALNKLYESSKFHNQFSGLKNLKQNLQNSSFATQIKNSNFNKNSHLKPLTNGNKLISIKSVEIEDLQDYNVYQSEGFEMQKNN